MCTIGDEFKKAFCELLLAVLRHNPKPTSELENALMDLANIIAKAPHALAMHNDIQACIKRWRIHWYQYLPGFDNSVRVLKFNVQNILRQPQFNVHRLIKAVIEEMAASYHALQDEIIQLQIENKKLLHVIENESSSNRAYERGVDEGRALVMIENTETIAILEQKIHHIQTYLQETLTENQRLKQQLEIVIEREKDLIVYNQSLITGNYIQIKSRPQMREAKKTEAHSLPRRM